MLPYLTGRSTGTDGVILWCDKFAEICRSLLSAFGNWKKRNGLERGIRKNSCNQNVWKLEGWEKGNWVDSLKLILIWFCRFGWVEKWAGFCLKMDIWLESKKERHWKGKMGFEGLSLVEG